MPKFGLTMHDGTLQRYFKAPGEPVNAGEPLYEVETEKVLYIVEAPGSGTFASWLHEEGATVECGGLVAVIAEPGEDASTIAAKFADTKTAPVAASIQVRAARQSTSSPNNQTPGAGESRPTADSRRPISPVARKLATELGVNLDAVTGTGPGGRVTREDIERAAQSRPQATDSVQTRQFETQPTGGAISQATSVPLRGIRKVIATRMHQSLRDTAQLTISSEVDVTAAVELRTRLTGEFAFTYTDMLIQAAARALRHHPRMNSRLSDDAILILPEINVGMAVALDEGLIVPVVRNADKASLREVAASTRSLGERARAGKLAIEDVSGATFTITNLGTWGVDAFTPILNIGETGILGVGRIVEKPVVYHGEIVKRAMLTLSLTFDHRVIDGAPAAAFLQTVADIFNYGER